MPRHRAPVPRPHAVDDGARHLVLLVPRRAAADGCCCRSARTSCGLSEAASTRLFTCLGVGIGARQPRRRPAVGRQGRTRPGADRRDRHGRCQRCCSGRRRCRRTGSSRGAARCSASAGGLFAVPLNALLQQRPDERREGPRARDQQRRCNTVGILLASAVVCGPRPTCWHWRRRRSSCSSASFTLVGDRLRAVLLPDFFVRFVLWLLTHTIYRIRIVGRPNMPLRGPALSSATTCR